MSAATRSIMPGAEPFEYPGRPDIGVLLVHGFTGSPFEMRPIGTALATDGIGSIGVLLRGHGTHPDDMVGRRHTDWIADVEAGLERLMERHERVVIVGLSMGGTLALNVAAQRASDTRLVGVVTIGATLLLNDWRLGAVHLLSRFIKWQAWGKPDIKDRSAWDSQVVYRRIRTASIPALVALMRETRELLPLICQPIVIVHARDDHVVPLGNADLIRDGVSSPDRQVLILDNCYHVSTVDFEADLLNGEIARFVRRFGSSSSPLPGAADVQSV